MKKRKILAEVKYEDYGSQKTLDIPLDYSLSKEMCLTLMTLYRGLVTSLEIEFIGYSVSLRPNDEKQSYCLSLNVKEKRAEVSISLNALGLIVNFLLKYFRDDIGEAKHIDADFKMPNDEELTLTFVLDKFKMLSQEEMENLLND